MTLIAGPPASSEFPPSADLGPAPTSPFGDPPSHGGIMVPRWLALVLAVVVVFGGGIAIGRWAIGSRSSSSVEQELDDADHRGARTAEHRHERAESGHRAAERRRLHPERRALAERRPGEPADARPLQRDLRHRVQRTTRLEDVVQDTSGTTVLSTEAVLYQSAADSARAFEELKSVAAKCPNSPVQSPVGEPSVTTKFDPAPDARWPATPAGVDRLAFSFTTTDAQGRSTPSVATYLRRGKALMGVYFSEPTMPQPTVGGQTSIPNIVNVSASRPAQLPASNVS